MKNNDKMKIKNKEDMKMKNNDKIGNGIPWNFSVAETKTEPKDDPEALAQIAKARKKFKKIQQAQNITGMLNVTLGYVNSCHASKAINTSEDTDRAFNSLRIQLENIYNGALEMTEQLQEEL